MPQNQQIIRIERRLSEAEIQALRVHVAERGLTDLPFGATVQTPKR